MSEYDTPETIDRAVREAVALGRFTCSRVLNVGYVAALACERRPDSRLLTVVEDTDGRGVAYAHYFTRNPASMESEG